MATSGRARFPMRLRIVALPMPALTMPALTYIRFFFTVYQPLLVGLGVVDDYLRARPPGLGLRPYQAVARHVPLPHPAVGLGQVGKRPVGEAIEQHVLLDACALGVVQPDARGAGADVGWEAAFVGQLADVAVSIGRRLGGEVVGCDASDPRVSRSHHLSMEQ